MKHLLCEHQNNITEFRAFDSLSTEERQREQEKLERDLHKEIKSTITDMLVSNEHHVKELQMVCTSHWSVYLLILLKKENNSHSEFFNRNTRWKSQKQETDLRSSSKVAHF